ncbi:MAG: flagellar biosynthesis protein FlhB [Ignavibacteriaceae bacterium]|jgi:flagellar biosynthetic protein FlhB
MAESEGQEKSEQASGKKLSDAREKGQVAKSQEVNSLALFGAGMMLIFLSQQFLSGRISSLTIKTFNTLDTLTINRNSVQEMLLEDAYFLLTTLAPILGGLVVIAFVVNVAQVGFKFSAKALMPTAGKFNPFKKIKEMFFSSRSFVEVSKSLLKLIIIGLFTYFVLADLITKSTALVELSMTEIANFMLESAYTLLWKISMVFAVIAAVDFLFQRYKFKQDMMMTKQEVKEENKQSEGDPLIKSRIKRMQLQAARSRMMGDVPKADVVITNPTHYAIAIKYDLDKDSAPRVLAKGVDSLAQRIKEVAVKNNVPLHEDRQLARALYKLCDVGDQIPQSLFKAVAQILAYIFQLKNYRKKTIV